MNKTKKTIPSETFTDDADGTIYKFTAHSFTMGGKKITAQEALKNEVVLAKLVKMKSGVIQAVGKEQKPAE